MIEAVSPGDSAEDLNLPARQPITALHNHLEKVQLTYVYVRMARIGQALVTLM